MRWLSRL